MMQSSEYKRNIAGSPYRPIDDANAVRALASAIADVTGTRRGGGYGHREGTGRVGNVTEGNIDRALKLIGHHYTHRIRAILGSQSRDAFINDVKAAHRNYI